MPEPLGQRRMLVVEDQPLFRDLLVHSLSTAGFGVVGAANPSEAVRAWSRHDPDGAVIDLDLGSTLSGVAVAHRIRHSSPEAAIVILTAFADPRMFAPDALPVGCSYLNKRHVDGTEALVTAVHRALIGASPTIRHDKARLNALAELTDDQVSVLAMIADGSTNEEIARRRGTSERAVERLVARVTVKLGIQPDGPTNARIAMARMMWAS